MPQLGVILAEGGDPERLLALVVMNAVLLKLRTGYPPAASMTAVGLIFWATLLIVCPFLHAASVSTDIDFKHSAGEQTWPIFS
jgi:hypothetical protein